MSRNSPLESASAPSAERRFNYTLLVRKRCVTAPTTVPSTDICKKSFKKLPHRRHHLSHRCRVDAGVDNLRPTSGLPTAACTTRSKSTMHPSAGANCPQSIHNPTHLPRWAYRGLSPMCTGPITVACISQNLLLRRRHLGTHRFGRRRATLRRLTSPRSISFQVEPESSTVVHQQPLRSLVRIGETRSATPRNRWLDLIVV
jgi:hypothetical protein